MWTQGLAEWYSTHGRHHLPWRQTLDPWAVLVSEVMLQQTSVARVLPRWDAFLQRWPAPADCSAAPLDEVLREWQGLGYPRRARALWLTAGLVSAAGWPADEAGLRTLPGVGVYTARALLAFSALGHASRDVAPPRDVNLARVASRAALGLEPHETTPAVLDGVLREARPAAMTVREYGYALFDVGATHCRVRPRCHGCPVAAACAALRRTTLP
nr:A/G-specific adenine glycosylase [Candidatus Dormibacteraeota bacterium]